MSFAMLSAPLASAATAGTARRMRSPGPAAGAGAIASALTYGGRKRCPRALSSLATSSATSFSRQNAGGMRGLGSGGLTRCAASSNDDDVAEEEIDGGLSSSFAEELRRRRSAGGGESGGESGGKEDKWGPRSENDLSFDDAPRFTKDDGARGVETDQLKRSRELNSEGLEGFPARAGELLKLGLASFISFGKTHNPREPSTLNPKPYTQTLNPKS